MRSAYVRRLGAVVCRTGTRSLSAPPQKPPPPPSPAEIAKMVEVSEAKVTKIREGAMKTVQPPAVADVPDLPTYLPSDVKEIRVLNDQPENQRARKVTIRQNAQTAMQSGQAKSYAWTITWPNQERWSNPLMGWTSSADPLSNMTMFFDSPEEAARFATRQGWPYEIEAPINRHHPLGTKKYAHNFLPEDVENTLKKEGVKTKQFKHPGGNASHWFQSLTFHGDGECEQHGPTGAATKAAKNDVGGILGINEAYASRRHKLQGRRIAHRLYIPLSRLRASYLTLIDISLAPRCFPRSSLLLTIYQEVHYNEPHLPLPPPIR